MKYKIIYADPPWHFTGYVKEVKGEGIIRPSLNYNTMKDEEIVSLPVKNIISDDAILFLWVVDSRIPLIDRLMKEWGFTYKTVGFVWNKVAKHTTGVNATFSKYTRKSCEFLFIGTRGKCLAVNHTQNQYYPEPKTVHSRKPVKIKELIVNMCGDLPRIELFARQKTEGWDVFGDEVEGSIKLDDYVVRG